MPATKKVHLSKNRILKCTKFGLINCKTKSSPKSKCL